MLLMIDSRRHFCHLTTLQIVGIHADPGRSRPGFSKIYTPHNLLPQQNVREEAIVYCQSINNLDC